MVLANSLLERSLNERVKFIDVKGARMRRNLIIFTLLFATAFLILPLDSYGSTDRSNNGATVSQFDQNRLWQGRERRGHGKHKRWKKYHGYRNYGQYRRTRVGNRRYRMVRRYYWNNGTRVPRLVRLYY